MSFLEAEFFLLIDVVYAGKFRVNQEASAVFADDDFFVHLDFHFALGRDAVEAAAAGVTLHVDNSESVVSVAADTFECFQ